MGGHALVVELDTDVIADRPPGRVLLGSDASKIGGLREHGVRHQRITPLRAKG